MRLHRTLAANLTKQSSGDVLSRLFTTHEKALKVWNVSKYAGWKPARANAFMNHRGYVIPEDVKSVGMDVLRHRVILTYEAEAEELSSEDIIQQIFDTVDVP